MQLEFREGRREVLDHLAVYMRDMETFKMTYDEAVAKVNQKLQSDYINKAYDSVIDGHMKRLRGEF